jgi:hypothetical protein
MISLSIRKFELIPGGVIGCTLKFDKPITGKFTMGLNVIHNTTTVYIDRNKDIEVGDSLTFDYELTNETDESFIITLIEIIAKHSDGTDCDDFSLTNFYMKEGK